MIKNVTNAAGEVPHQRASVSSINVRPATAADAPDAIGAIRASIIELCIDSHHDDEATLARWLQNKTPDHFLQWLANSDNFIVVAEHQSELSGVASLARKGELNLCYVRPGHEHIGVGRALLLAVETQARAWGFAEIRLNSTLTARAFYERNGFTSAGPPALSFAALLGYPYVKALAESPRPGTDRTPPIAPEGS